MTTELTPENSENEEATPLPNDLLPIVFEHCKTVYDAMDKKAKLVYPDGEAPEDVLEPGVESASHPDEMLVWEGMLTALITKELHFSVPYYSKIRNELMRMGCIRQLRRGGGSSPSQWELICAPTRERFLSDNTDGLPKSADERRLLMLEERLDTLQESLKTQSDLFVELVQRLSGEGVLT
jgi:hypothetical protein